MPAGLRLAAELLIAEGHLCSIGLLPPHTRECGICPNRYVESIHHAISTLRACRPLDHDASHLIRTRRWWRAKSHIVVVSKRLAAVGTTVTDNGSRIETPLCRFNTSDHVELQIAAAVSTGESENQV